jgi:hypothetical protein
LPARKLVPASCLRAHGATRAPQRLQQQRAASSPGRQQRVASSFGAAPIRRRRFITGAEKVAVAVVVVVVVVASEAHPAFQPTCAPNTFQSITSDGGVRARRVARCDGRVKAPAAPKASASDCGYSWARDNLKQAARPGDRLWRAALCGCVSARRRPLHSPAGAEGGPRARLLPAGRRWHHCARLVSGELPQPPGGHLSR